MYIKCTKNTQLTKQKNTLNNVHQEVVMDTYLQMYSTYDAKFKLVNHYGHTIEYDKISLCYDKELKNPWIIKLWNSRKGKIKFRTYTTKKEAQSFIRGRKRRLKKRAEYAKEIWKLDFKFEYEESKDY